MKGFELTTFGTSVFYHKHETKLKKSRCGPFEFRSRAIVHGMHFSSFENFLLFRIAFTFSGVSLCVSYTSIWWRSRKCRFCRVTRLGNLLHFGQLFKACGINYFEKLPTSWGNWGKSFIFLVESFWATFVNIWQLFTGQTDSAQVLICEKVFAMSVQAQPCFSI